VAGVVVCSSGGLLVSAMLGPGFRDLGCNLAAHNPQRGKWQQRLQSAFPVRVLKRGLSNMGHAMLEEQPNRGEEETVAPHRQRVGGPGTKPGVVATMPSLISSRQRAGQPIVAANRCASVVLPDPAGPLTITKVGRPTGSSLTRRSLHAVDLVKPCELSPHQPLWMLAHHHGGGAPLRLQQPAPE
jgi:hypothetical protein